MPIRKSVSGGKSGSTFGVRVSKLRNEKRLSQVQLGKAVGVSGTCIWNWEEDNTFPRPGSLNKLATVLDTTEEFLRDGPQPDGLSHAAASGNTLSELIKDCRLKIAEAAGVGLAAVRVSLDYDS